MSRIKLQSEYDDLDKYDDYGDIFYYKKNTKIFHNPYGAAFIRKNEYMSYYIDNKYHRLDGPAIIYSNGEEFYYINDELLTKEQFERHPERLKFLGKEYLICLK